MALKLAAGFWALDFSDGVMSPGQSKLFPSLDGSPESLVIGVAYYQSKINTPGILFEMKD